MRRTPFLLASIAAAWLPIASSAAADPPHVDYKAGDFVVVIRASELRVENQTVDRVEPGILMGVDIAQGDWLWVTNQKSGWLSTANVMPAQNAVDYFTAAIRRNPSDARLYSRRGVARALNKNIQGALADYQEAIRLKPAEAVYYGDRGCFYMAAGDFDRAIADFAEEIKRIGSEDPNRREIRLQWLNQRMAEAQAQKSSNSAAAIGKPE
ncbi:MAG TPA: tetratricopeptide repeat protein [Pirellulales bacterium]|nr:tetratricopeptide repeat protein [Pirellulales bacterium]